MVATDPFEGMSEDLRTKFGVHEGKFNVDQVKFLVYGESGVGKTVFSATWPDVCFLDIDKGMSSITREVHSFDINYWEDLLEAAEFLTMDKHPFKTVVLDSLNELQYLSMKHVVKTYPSVRRSYDSLPGVSDYGKMLADVDAAVRYIRAIPLNVILIAQVANREFETDPVQPQLTGKATARNISRMMDVVGYLDKREATEGAKLRVMIFDATNYVTKDRSGKLPQMVENPTYEKLLKYWTSAA